MSSFSSFGRSRASRVTSAALLFSVGAVVVISAACGNSDDSPGLVNTVGNMGGGKGSGTTDSGAGDSATSADGATGGDSGIDAGVGCADGVKDNLETDVDCGGTVCQPCADGKMCKEISDCSGGGCTNNICDTPTCSDKILNEDETDTDCGGSKCPKCTVGRKCDVSGDCTTAACNGGACACPSDMVIVPQAELLGGGYCIDVTEVLKGKYNTFIEANYPLGNQVAGCSDNLSYVPRDDWPPALVPENVATNEPVHYVDWCDAYAYCQSISRELCGNIGGGKLPDGLSTSDLNTATTGGAADASSTPLDAWYNACSAEGGNIWPYAATTFHPGACNDPTLYDGGAGGGIWVDYDTSNNLYNTTCFGGVAGLYQMSGNVAEWENACSATSGSTDTCSIRGGAYDSPVNPMATTDLQCKWQGATRQRVPAGEETLADVGFRCCQY